MSSTSTVAAEPLSVEVVRFQHSLKRTNAEYTDESVRGISAEAQNAFAVFAADASSHHSSLLPVFSTFLSWVWKREVMQIISAWNMDEWIESVFVFFDAPYPAAEVFSAFAAATRLYVPPPSPAATNSSNVSAALASIHSFLATCLQRFLSQSRLADALQQLCDSESSRKHTPKSASAAAYTVIISPLSQSLIDQLSSFPDVLFNTLQRNVPYSLSQKEWHGGLVAAILQVIQSNAEKKDPSFLAPLSALIAKLTRLGQSEIVIEGLITPFIAHIQQLLTSDTSSPSFSLTPSPATASLKAAAAFTSPYITHLSTIVCCVGVQSMESFIVSLFQWLGVRWRYTASEKQKFIDANQDVDKEVLQYEAALQSVCPSLFPLKFFQSSSFFSLLVTRKLLTHKVVLSPSAQHVLADYVGFVSSAALALLPQQERTHKRVGHETILDQCLLTTIQSWVGSEGGNRGHESSVATAMAADMQMALGRAILFLLVKVEETLNSSPLPASASSSSSSGFKLDPENADLAAKDDGAPINSLTSFANSPCVPLLLTGIHSRLSSPLVQVRRNAMKIAKQFSRLMGGQENELDFEGEELDPHEKASRSKSSNLFDEDDDEHMQDENSANANLTPASIINPLHVSSPSNASSFQAYSLADDEKDLRKVKPPAFLREALEYLQKKLESHDHVEAALEALPGLIRRHPADLPVLTGQLLASLLNVGSNVFVETHDKLAKWRIESLVALSSTSRGADIRVLSQSIQYLISQFYGQSHSMGVKLEILAILLKAAEYLADMNQEEEHSSSLKKLSSSNAAPLIQEVSSSRPGSSLVPINTPIYNSGSSAKEVSSTLAQHQAIIRDRVEKRTKRWGSTKLNKESADGAAVSKSAKPERHYSVNRFTEVSHLFFYPLMKPLDEPAALLQLQQHDSLLLMRLLHTVSAFIPCCSGLAQTLPMAARRMSKVLMEYLLMSAHRIDMNRLSIRAQSAAAMPAAAQVGMRRMIFFALSRILVSYNEALFADDFPHELPELVSWLTDAVENDKDPECRQLAQANLYFLRELLGNPFENLFKQGSNSAASTASMISAQLPPLKF